MANVVKLYVFRARCARCDMHTTLVLGYPVGSHGAPPHRCTAKAWVALEKPRPL